MKTKNILIAVFFMISAISLSSCKDELKEITTLKTDAVFSPTGLTISIVNITQAKFTWNQIGKADSYTLEFFDNPNKDFTGTPYKIIEGIKLSDLPYTAEGFEGNTTYSVRLKAVSSDIQDSKYVESTFKTGVEQLFLPIYSSQITETTALFKWKVTAGITRIVLTPVSSGSPITVPIDATAASAGQITATGLTPNTNYEAKIYSGTVSRGKLAFTTDGTVVATLTLSPSNDLAAAIIAAANNAVIALQPGTYDLATAGVNTEIIGKSITIKSVSGKFSDTKINFKQFNLKGSGAGIKFSGIELDGTTVADYFINLIGANADGDAATFKSIVIENCKVHSTKNCLIRANRATTTGTQKIDDIVIENSILYDNGISSYSYLMLDKADFKTISITNSTIYNSARQLISWATAFTASQTPAITIDHITLNGFGSGAKNNIILDANTNPVNFVMQNSIVANTPRDGQTVGNNAIKGGGTLNFNNNDYFKLNTGSGDQVTLSSSVTATNNKTVDLGWTTATTTFALPKVTELRTSGTQNDPIGDPRWH